MRSFHHSRGRVFFEVLCALGISASCVGAWMQTGATAMLAAASVAALYGLVHAFDMIRRNPVVVEPVVELVTDREVDVPIHQNMEISAPPNQSADNPGEVVEPIDTTARANAGRRSKAPRKNGSRRTKASKEAKVSEPVALDEPKITDFAPPENAAASEPMPAEEAEVEAPVSHEEGEEAHAPVVPLFETDPFVRQQRTVFGRKAG